MCAVYDTTPPLLFNIFCGRSEKLVMIKSKSSENYSGREQRCQINNRYSLWNELKQHSLSYFVFNTKNNTFVLKNGRGEGAGKNLLHPPHSSF
jgi:hypothetical protein